MCDTCGCNITPANRHLVEGNGKLAKTGNGGMAITVLKSLLTENDRIAAHNREHFDSRSVLAINLMSSPGAGKTALLESTILALDGKYNIAVIEGDLETENDAERIRQHGVQAIQISTGTACHLDAHMIHDAVHQIDLGNLDIIFIENVGNLVCPASFDLGHHCNVTLLSVPEGDDKPSKYPVMFRAADLMLLSKTDLLPYMDDFDPERASRNLRNLANHADIIPLSARNGAGMDDWLAWIDSLVAKHRDTVRNSKTLLPSIQPDSTHLHRQTEPAHDHS